MERENFYLLLELSLKPPETDDRVIDQAIRIKQSQWSRLRNHPTRALEAKQRIAMLSEIRTVMADPERRAREAQAAIAIVRKKAREKYNRIDRHIGMYLTKGPVTDEEINKLTVLHGFSEKEIRSRIEFLESNQFTIAQYLSRHQKIVKTLPDDEKIADIHKNLLIRMVKGYITDYEIEKLSIFYDYPASEIRALVTVPVWENNKKGAADTFTVLDKSVEKNISTNLKIVGKFSLYEFLDVIPSTSLAAIQARARQKRKETQAAGAKSAEVTAAGALAGYSISIFRSVEDRKAYDMALARGILSTFHSDITMAAVRDQIRPEYFRVLLRFAMDYALDEDDAIRFIEDFSRRHGWKVRSGRAVRRRLLIAAAVIGGILLSTLGAIGLIYALEYSRAKTDYTLLLSQTNRVKRLEDKRDLLRHYIDARDIRNKFTQEAVIQLQWVEHQIREQYIQEDRFFQNKMIRAEDLKRKSEYDDARQQIHGYLKQYPRGRYVQEARRYMTKLTELMEVRDFQALRVLPKTDVAARIQAYRAFLTGYAESARAPEVRAMLDALGVEYGRKLLKEVASAEARQDWDQCVRLCREYLEHFAHGELAPKFSGLLRFYEDRQQVRKP